MLKNLFLVTLATLISVYSSGCFYADVRIPLDDDVDQTQLGSKVGMASTHSVLWLVAWGDASTEAAADDGELEIINHLDLEYYSILFGAYSRRTTIAYGD